MIYGEMKMTRKKLLICTIMIFTAISIITNIFDIARNNFFWFTFGIMLSLYLLGSEVKKNKTEVRK